MISFRRRLFRLSERAVVRLTAGGRVYARTYQAGLFSFALPSSPRAYTIYAEDAAGNVSGTLRSR